MSDKEKKALIEQLDRAHAVVVELCHGRKWTMSVPARIDHDPDLIIGGALRHARTAILAADAELTALREFQCRTTEAFQAIQGDINYSQKVKLETAIYGSYSCPHAALRAGKEG